MDKQKIEEMLKVDLLEALGFKPEDLENNEVAELLAKAEFVVGRGIWIKIFESLVENKQEELSSLLETSPEDQEAITAFLQRELPNYENIIKKEVARYKELLISKMKK